MVKAKPAKNPTLTGNLKKLRADKKIIVIGCTFAGLLIIILGFITWYEKVYSAPTAVFWGMISNNLATKGVSKEISQASGTSTTDAVTQVVFTPTARVRYVKTISDTSTKPNTQLTLEGIGTPSDDYQRYSKIVRPAEAGKSAADYSKIYESWLRQDTKQSNSQLFSNAIFSAVLFGNLPAPDRQAVVQKLHDAYKPQFSEKSQQNGQHVYVYDVTLNLKKYAVAVKIYAKSLGLPGADQISPSAYREDAKVELKISVNVASRQIVTVEYKNAGTSEKYLSYGVAPPINLPSRTLNGQQFQDALNAIGQ